MKNLPREAIERILENEMHGAGKEIPKEETYSKYGDAARKIEIGAIGNMALLPEFPLAKFPYVHL